MQVAGIAIDAVSVGGMETCIQLPGHRLCFDIGRCPPGAVRCDTVLFTHGHVDHMGGLAHHCATRSLLGMAPPTYVVPPENLDAFHRVLDAWRQLDGSDLPCTVLPVGPGGEHVLKRDLVARPFRSPHRVPCQGYALWERKKRLRPDLVGASRDQIVAVRARGEDVNEHSEEAILAFTGDSLIEVVERHEVVRTARVLVMEVTFLDDRVSVDKCRDNGHIHLDEVIERAELFENRALVFSHVSARYRPGEARRIFEARLPASLRDRAVLLA